MDGPFCANCKQTLRACGVLPVIKTKQNNMSERELRQRTRKDYNKMAAGEINSNDDQFSDNSDDEVVIKKGINTESDEVSDGDVLAAEENLEEMRRQADMLGNKEKVRRLSAEAKQIQRSMNVNVSNNKKKKKSKKGKQKVQGGLTIASLRQMNEVTDEVDRLMDKKLKIKKKSGKSASASSSRYVSDSDSSSDEASSISSSESSSSSDTDSSSSEDKKGRKKSRRKKNKKKKDKSSGKHKSGKSKRLTSYVKFPQKWPHSHLSLHFVNRNKKFEELSLAEFCAGFATILEIGSESKRLHRIAHFKELMYLATRYQWKCVLNYHAACLLEIERGHLKWGDSFQVLQSTTLAGGFLTRGGSNGSNAASNGSASNVRSSASGAGSDDGPTVFCRNYQRGYCSHPRDHYGQFKGENRLLKHMCAKCWLEGKKIELHPENSDDCPLKQ